MRDREQRKRNELDVVDVPAEAAASPAERAAARSAARSREAVAPVPVADDHELLPSPSALADLLPPAVSVQPVAPPDRGKATTSEAAVSVTPVVHPRSPGKRMLNQQLPESRAVRPRRLPAAPAPGSGRTATDVAVATGPWRWGWPVAVAAAIAWGGALLLLLTDAATHLPGAGSPQRAVALAWLVAAVLTFLPLQWRLALGGLGWQGVFGWSLLGGVLTQVPAPAGGLLDLPDVPVYLLLFLAVFYAVAAAVVPVAFVSGRRIFRDRLHRHDARRARRQGYLCGALAVAWLALASLRVLTMWTGLLLLVVVVLLETLFLSQMRPEG